MSGSGRGGSSRRNRQRFSGRKDESQRNDKKKSGCPVSTGKLEKNSMNMHERLRWTAPELPVNPITTPDCPWCGKPINDITTAISDKDSGRPVHFDCVLARINKMENLEANDSVCYIGGGRFGIIHYNNSQDTKSFTIKKIHEWEIKDINREWRRPISEYFSIT
jgi:hypothetical protein